MGRLAGVTLVANGVELNYPFVACINNLCACCDIVYVCTDVNNRDNTKDVLESLGPKVVVIESKWDWSITNGKDLAYRANLCIEQAVSDGCDMLLYAQADEVVDYKEINKLKEYKFWGTKNLSLERTYFWEDLNHITRRWTCSLKRLAPLAPGVRVVGDGMFMDVSPFFDDLVVPPSIARLYHYSRVGSTKDIASRLNNLDSLFHEDSEYTPLSDYTFGVNNNFETGADNPMVEEYYGTHPEGINEFYKH